MGYDIDNATLSRYKFVCNEPGCGQRFHHSEIPDHDREHANEARLARKTVGEDNPAITSWPVSKPSSNVTDPRTRKDEFTLGALHQQQHPTQDRERQ